MAEALSPPLQPGPAPRLASGGRQVSVLPMTALPTLLPLLSPPAPRPSLSPSHLVCLGQILEGPCLGEGSC